LRAAASVGDCCTPFQGAAVPTVSCRFLLPALLIVGLSGCGGGGSSAATTQQPQRRGFVFNNPKVAACLKQQGVQVPSRPRGQFGRPPAGQAPRRRPPGGSARFQKLREALQKCGATPPRFRGPTTTTTTPS
jgi:hypothetical protein